MVTKRNLNQTTACRSCAWYVEAMQHLDHLAAAMENVLLHQGSLMTPADRKSRDDAAHAAREFQHRINYRPAER
jgi:hypothetical protein